MGFRLYYSISIPFRTGIIIIVIVVGVLLAKDVFKTDEWRTFESNPNGYTTNYPVGYRIEYPANWNAEVYNGHHDLEDLLMVFRQPLSSNPRSLEIYWQSQSGMDSQSVVEWGDEIMSGWAIPKSTPLITQTTGMENNAVIKKEYTLIEKQNDYQVSYFIIANDDVFMLSFQAKEFDEQTKAIFERMLASFDIYK